MNCQTETPAARAMTSSLLRVTRMKAAMLPNSTAKGSVSLPMVGSLRKDMEARMPKEMSFWLDARRVSSTRSII